MSETGLIPSNYAAVRDNLLKAISVAQAQALTQVNVMRTTAYWLIGQALIELQPDDNAGYGTRLVAQMSLDLRQRLGARTGFSPTDLKYARMLAGAVPAIGAAMSQGSAFPPVAALPWGHVRLLLDKFRNSPAKLDWYAATSLREGWSRAVLTNQIAAGAADRAGRALTNVNRVEPEAASDLVAEMGKDPMVFDWLPVGAAMREAQLEDALVSQLARLMTELGHGFLWAGRQCRLVLADASSGQEKEFFLDLLFYHKRSRRWLVIDLKVHDFDPRDAMQVSVYARLVDAQLRDEHDNPTVGMVLCPSRHPALAELALSMLNTPTFVTTYAFGSSVVDRDQLPAELRQALPGDNEISEVITDVLSQAAPEAGTGTGTG